MIDAERLRTRMLERDLSQSELARRVGITQATIFKLASGKSYGSTHLHKIARALDTTPAYLTGETDDPAGETPEIDLTPDEQKLLKIYRELGKKDQAALRRLIEHMQPRGEES